MRHRPLRRYLLYFKRDGVLYGTRSYRYEDPYGPNLLTGIDDESAQRYATWTYDGTGRVTSSVHGDPAGDIDRTAIAHGVTGSTVTSALGEQVAYERVIQHGRAKVASGDRLCAGCGSEPRTYDINGSWSLGID